MTRKIMLAAAVAAMTLATSCVTNKKYNALQTEYQATRDGLLECNSQTKSMEYLIKDLKSQNASLERQLEDMKATLNQSLLNSQMGSANIAKLVDEINSPTTYNQAPISPKSKTDSLNIALTIKLTRALSNDELRDVDIKVLKGVVYISLADNMLFNTGSYEISDRAMDTLSKIAKIIKDYKDYDVLVEGNTDNVPISRTNIRNNWDLSALRASSVVQVLQDKFGVNPSRLTAGGRGEYNPIADNTSDLGRQRNRRTEIIITPKLDQFLDLIDQAPEQD